MKKQDTTMKYEIRVQGYLGENAAIWFDGFEMEYAANGDTILHGTIIDQAALHGVLIRIRDLGLTLISIKPINKDS